MRQVVIFIIFLFWLKSSIFGQRNLTKDEIYNHWVTTENKSKQDSLIARFDRQTNYIASRLIDSLRNLKIDSIIVYSISYPGSIAKSKCINGLYPVHTYLIWKSNRQTTIKKIEGKCFFEEQNINSTALFDFYDKNQQQVARDFIMPAIYSGQVDTNGTFSFIETLAYHEPKYFLYFSFGEYVRVIEFAQNDLQDEKSLFHQDNLNSKLYLWWQVIKEQTK